VPHSLHSGCHTGTADARAPGSATLQGARGPAVQGYLAHKKRQGEAVSYERGTSAVKGRMPTTLTSTSFPIKGTRSILGVVRTNVLSLRSQPVDFGANQVGEAARSNPLSSEYGTNKTVKARFWPWLSGKVLQPFEVAPVSLGSAPASIWSGRHAESGFDARTES